MNNFELGVVEQPRQTARIEGWKLATFGDMSVLQGYVYGHPRFRDGSPVTTSLVTEIDTLAGVARTRNTDYTLGTPGSDE